MTIWIAGAGGNLGSAVARVCGDHSLPHVATRRADLDLTEAARVAAFIGSTRPALVINCVAYTAVDRAEDEPGEAAQINAGVAGTLGRLCAAAGIPMLQPSTDYVFDGDATEPYGEDAPGAPLGVYGRSQLAAEAAVLGSGARGWIVRTSWLFGGGGNDFVGRMAALMGRRSEVSVVDDQRGRPTYAPDLAGAILRLAGYLGGPPAPPGRYHFANTGETTWFGLARTVARLCGSSCVVRPISSADYGARARRPAYGVLSTAKYEAATGHRPRPWEEALAACLGHRDPGG